MKTFEQWLKEDAPTATPQPTANPVPQQPAQQQQIGPDIAQGQEAIHVNQIMQGGNIAIDPEDFGKIFTSGMWYLANQGQPQMQKFYNTIKAAFKNDIMGKYMDDASRMTIQRRVWDRETMPNTMQYDNSWVNEAFRGYAEEGEGQHWLDRAVDVGSELAARLANVTQGKSQSSVFSQ